MNQSSSYFPRNYDYPAQTHYPSYAARGSSWGGSSQSGSYAGNYGTTSQAWIGSSRPSRPSAETYGQTSSVLGREVNQKHFYDFLERPKNPRTGFSELTAKMLEKDIYLNSLRPWNPTPARYNQYVPPSPAAPFSSAKYRDVNTRLEALRQRLDSNKFQEFQTPTPQPRFVISHSGFGPNPYGSTRVQPQVVRPVERATSEKVIRLSTPAVFGGHPSEIRETPAAYVVRDSSRLSGASPTTFRSIPTENQVNLRSTLIQSSIEAVKNEVSRTPNCSFQNFDAAPSRVYYSSQRPVDAVPNDASVVRIQSSGILSLSRVHSSPVPAQPFRSSVTRIESKTYVGTPVQTSPAVGSAPSYFLSSTYSRPADNFSSYAQHVAKSDMILRQPQAVRVIEASPAPRDSLRNSMVTIDQSMDDESPCSPLPKSSLRSILKRHCSRNKTKRVTVDENKNEVKEFEKASPRKMSICLPADTTHLKILTAAPGTLLGRPLPSQPRAIQPFAVVATNVAAPTAPNRQFEAPHIRTHSRIML